MTHGRSRDVERSTRVASVAKSAALGLDAERSRLYFDLIIGSLSEAARRALKSMDTQTYLRTYGYQSDFARGYVAQGRVDTLSRLLSLKFGPLSAEARNLIGAATMTELDHMIDRLLEAKTLEDVLQSYVKPR